MNSAVYVVCTKWSIDHVFPYRYNPENIETLEQYIEFQVRLCSVKLHSQAVWKVEKNFPPLL